MSFNHKYELVVSETETSGDNQALRIEDLQVEFDVQRSTKSKMNQTKVSVYNLSESSRNLIKSFEQKNGFITLSAGYRDSGVSQIFIGNIVKLETFKKDADIVTEITCADGHAAVKDSVTNRRFPEKSTLKSIIETIATQDMNLSIGEVLGKNLNKVFENGLTVEGNSYKYLKNVSEMHQLQLSIQNNSLTVLPNQGTSARAAINISKDTGILGSPQFTGQSASETSDTKNPKSGIRLDHILLPSAIPGRIMIVNSQFASGSYKIESVSHRGSFRGSSWTTSIEGSIVSVDQEEEL